MIVAELEVRHSRDIAPTRRVALGALYLPTEPAPPGYGGLLLAAIVGALCCRLDDDTRDGLDRLISDLEQGWGSPQPRLRHRFQTDVHGLDRSRHRLVEAGDSLRLELDEHAAALPQILGAVYAAARLSSAARPAVFRLLRRATRWDGDTGEGLLRYLCGDNGYPAAWRAFGDERWALEILGFKPTAEPARSDILRSFRSLVRQAHPDTGAAPEGAGERITLLSEAKRILLAGG